MNYGSLSTPYNPETFEYIHETGRLKRDFILPSGEELKNLIEWSYRDLSEIFVHILDFTYVYSSRPELYLKSIWSSWSWVSTVHSDIDEYIMRTLVVLGLDSDSNDSEERFEIAMSRFIKLLEQDSNSIPIFTEVLSSLSDTKKRDFYYRFINCIRIADIISKFFVVRLEAFFDKKDERIFRHSGNRIYDINRGDFVDDHIRSKLRFAFDQLLQSIEEGKEGSPGKQGVAFSLDVACTWI